MLIAFYNLHPYLAPQLQQKSRTFWDPALV
jgi:hypothetical protein